MAITMQELDVHNHLLDDHEALERTYREEGYLFFRDVIDRGAVKAVQAKYFAVLVEDYGVVDPESDAPLWNGKDVSNFPLKVPEVYGSGTWEAFVATPEVHGFFERVMGEPIVWIPSTEYRLNAPTPDVVEDFGFVHQDGFFNEGVSFRTCWLPFTDIDAEAGGLAIAPGVHKLGYLHDKDAPPRYPIPDGAIPAEAWRRPRVYHPGDVVIFDERTPHVGMTNRSDRFRLSMDIRFAPASAPQPVVGHVAGYGEGTITVDTESGQVTLSVDQRSYVRGADGLQQDPREIAAHLPIGQKVIVGREGDRALVVRPQKG